jgi:hypothetical protein
MIALKHKAPLKCECGQNVAVGSVFCPFCRSEVQKKNDKITNREEKKYQTSVKGKGRK